MKTGAERTGSTPLSLLNTITLSFIVLFLAGTALSFAAAVDDEIARIQKAYENIKDMKGSFIQKSFIKDLKRTDTYSGQFFIKPPKVKWEFKGDKPQTVYITGQDIIIYQKKEKQAFKAKFDRATYGQAPIALLGGFGEIRKEFDASMKNEKLLLKPKRPMGNIVQIELSTNESGFPVASLTIIDTLSNKVEIVLKNVMTNTGISDKMFEFSPPEGVNIVEQ
ncbi:MAG: LolA family protein [Nitrospirota bacterium]